MLASLLVVGVAVAVPMLWRAAEAEIGTDIEIALPRPGVATVRGHALSLRGVIEDLCLRAGVDLQAYDAPDRPIAATYDEQPLSEVLRRLLQRESFLIGITHDAEAGQPRVGWLRVLGAYEDGTLRRASAAPARDDGVFRLPPTLLHAAFASPDPATRQQALEGIAQRILSDQSERRRFLDTEARLIAEAVAGFPGAAASLQAMESHPGLDDALRAQIAAVVAALGRE